MHTCELKDKHVVNVLGDHKIFERIFSIGSISQYTSTVFFFICVTSVTSKI